MNLIEYGFECPMCRKQKKTLVAEEKIPQIINKTDRIQNILSPLYFDTTYRELFLSHICSSCQIIMFGDNNEVIYDVDYKDSTRSIEPIIERMYNKGDLNE